MKKILSAVAVVSALGACQLTEDGYTTTTSDSRTIDMYGVDISAIGAPEPVQENTAEILVDSAEVLVDSNEAQIVMPEPAAAQPTIIVYEILESDKM